MDCFIIMPITTPENCVDIYGDPDHFKHVLDHLFIPAVEAANMTPIPPIAKGADIIHAEIIKNIETAEFVLCDMSSLNPNVFFELGIRTAVNRPVALIRDDLTGKVPFDASMINNHTYSSSLQPWILKEQVKKLTEHIEKCKEGSKSGNTLWKYFSISAVQPIKGHPDKEDQLEFLAMQFQALRQEIHEANNPQRSNNMYMPAYPVEDVDAISKDINTFLTRRGIKVQSIVCNYSTKTFSVCADVSKSTLDKIKQELFVFLPGGYKVTFHCSNWKPK